MAANILIVDDTPENLTVLRDILAREGHKVRPVLSGELALRIARMEPPDLVLLDVLMPGLNGYQTCEQLKADPLTADCPVLFISALDAVADKLRGFQAGGLDYITKPFQVEEVLARVRTHLALSQAQRQLRQQNEQLAEAARLREDVDRMLRHDLRGPLANVLAFSELVQSATRASQPEVAEHGRVIGEAAYALLSMVHGSFDLLKMERGEYALQAELFDLAELLQGLLREMRPPAEVRGLELALALPPGPPWVCGEALLTRSLFHNLLRNAMEAAPAGSRIVVTVAAEPAANRWGVAVRNAGEVPPAIRSRFFEKYVTQGKAQGSGLGTYSARLMAHAQGGGIQLDTSEPGQTCLRVSLPAAPSTADVADPPGPPGDVSRQRCTRLLVADDDPAVHRYLACTLPASLSVESVHDGELAWQALTQAGPEAGFTHALVDLHMPGLGGMALAERYAQAVRQGTWTGQACQWMALSADGDATTHQRCLSAGFTQVLRKPPSVPALLALLGWADTTEAPSPPQIDPDLAALIPAFLRSREEELARLAAAIAQKRPAEVASIAHKLHGSFAMYGFDTASQLAFGIEQAANTDLHQAQVLWRDLSQHLVQFDAGAQGSQVSLTSVSSDALP